jgi:rhamnogalacturonyl hydrolase YesR
MCAVVSFRDTIVVMRADAGCPRRKVELVMSIVEIVVAAALAAGLGASGEPSPPPSASCSVPSGEASTVLTPDGAWNWCNGPHAVFHEGKSRKTYVGWVTATGTVQVSSYDHDTSLVQVATLRDSLEADDHSAPAILVRPDDRLMVFYSPHCRTMAEMTPGGKSIAGMFYRISERPEDVSSWSDEVRLEMNMGDAFGWTYPTAVELANEGNRIYLVWRGGNGQPLLALSDNGTDWLFGGTFLTTGGIRPYFKMDSDGLGRIDIAFTRGHPNGEPENGIYYVRYRDGALYHADGRKIKDMWDLPLEPGECDTVYSGRGVGRAWLWDVAADSLGNPVIVYAVFPSEDDHRYRYARWDGTEWQDTEIVAAGRWFPRNGVEGLSQQVYYSGGIALDHSDPRVVYLSRPDASVFEIERWVTKDGGLTWWFEPVTCRSGDSNVRPIVPEGHAAGGPELIWMHGDYRGYTDYFTDLRMRVSSSEGGQDWLSSSLLRPAPSGGAPATPEDGVTAIARLVCAREIEAVSRGGQSANVAVMRRDGTVRPFLPQWREAVFYEGVMAAYELTGDERFILAARDWADRNEWRPGPRARHPDDLCVGQVYLTIWLDLPPSARKPVMTRAIQAAFDEMRADPGLGRDEWAWCDALFAVPPGLALLSTVTGDRTYLDLMDRMWWDTTEFLYDTDDHLFYRDARFRGAAETASAPESEGGVFWGRGNGWVMAGIARVLENMPEDYPTRSRYVRLLNEMAERVAGLQGGDGLWRSNLLDTEPGSPPETSGSALLCYAMAWGINHGALDRGTYLPVVRAAWSGLVGAVDESGKLGWVQGVADAPGAVGRGDSAEFGTGAFLLAAKEVSDLDGR